MLNLILCIRLISKILGYHVDFYMIYACFICEDRWMELNYISNYWGRNLRTSHFHFIFFFTFEILTNRGNPINLLREKEKKLLNTTRNNEVKLKMRGQLPFSSDDWHHRCCCWCWRCWLEQINGIVTSSKLPLWSRWRYFEFNCIPI